MSITWDTLSSRITDTASHNFTPDAGSNVVAMIFVEGEVDATDNVTGAKIDGNAATLIAKLQNNTHDYEYVFIYLLGITDGVTAHTIQVSASAGSPLTRVFLYDGVNQSTTPDASATNSATSTTDLATNITTVAGNCWVVGGATGSAGDLLFNSSGYVTRVQDAGHGNSWGDSAADLSSGSHSVNVHVATSQDIAVILVSLAPAAGATVHTLTTLGAGA